MHVDDFIDNPIPLQKFQSDAEREGVRYAKFVLQLMRSSAALFHDIEKFVPKLYCDHGGYRYRVEFVSRMGWLRLEHVNTKLLGPPHVEPDECSNWGAKP